MLESERDRLAKRVEDLRARFDDALSDKRKYPVQEFRTFVQSVGRYIALTASDPLNHKSVARAVHGLREFLEVERKHIPGDVEADQLECQLFDGYDPKFEGSESPGF